MLVLGSTSTSTTTVAASTVGDHTMGVGGGGTRNVQRAPIYIYISFESSCKLSKAVSSPGYAGESRCGICVNLPSYFQVDDLFRYQINV